MSTSSPGRHWRRGADGQPETASTRSPSDRVDPATSIDVPFSTNDSAVSTTGPGPARHGAASAGAASAGPASAGPASAVAAAGDASLTGVGGTAGPVPTKIVAKAAAPPPASIGVAIAPTTPDRSPDAADAVNGLVSSGAPATGRTQGTALEPIPVPSSGTGQVFRSTNTGSSCPPSPTDFDPDPGRDPASPGREPASPGRRRPRFRHAAGGRTYELAGELADHGESADGSGDGAGTVGGQAGDGADGSFGDGARKPVNLSKGEIVVPLRPVRTEEGYRSVYSDLTRPTVWTRLRTTARTLGEVLITLGLVVLLFAGYEIWGKGPITDAHQGELDSQLAQDWGRNNGNGTSEGISSALPGNAIARLYIPRMKKHWVVVQGVRPKDIKFAPGHYPSTVMPGQVGNFAVAGHRTRSIFWDLDRVNVGDPIIVETGTNWYVYKVTQSHVVTPQSVEVIAPVPNHPGETPTVAMLTLTTCNPKLNNYQRLVVHAQLAGKPLPHDGPKPAELEG